MNKKVPEITESVQDLKGLLRQAKKKHDIQRLNALHLLKIGQAKNRIQVAEARRYKSFVVNHPDRVTPPAWAKGKFE